MKTLGYLAYLLGVSALGIALAHQISGGGEIKWIDWGVCTNGHCVSHGMK